ncbi:xanthine dehydrogenase accessory protein XdhC [Novosphingobium sp.]|uniref:xanthine dehydrogenase accessory protein XdhC n=1 Tax=Novosphingobium sp. TaxID=1874826 RepID=UPI0033421725
MTEWLAQLRVLAGTAPVALVSVLASEGSAPRGAGTRMLVTADTLVGTIGGGQLEYRAVEQARAALLHPPGTWRVQDYPLGPLLGQCCGGRVRLLIEHVNSAALAWLADTGDESVLVTHLAAGGVERQIVPDAGVVPLPARGPLPGKGTRFAEVLGRYRRPIYLFGAGHVGQAIARHAAHLPLRLAWFDARPECAAIDGVTVIDADNLASCVADAPSDAAIVILTHDHGLDYTLARVALARSPLAYVGLIGSATKRARFLARLAGDGLSPQDCARLTCPIGLPGVPGKEPDVIAVATCAQLLGLGA